MIRSHEKEMRLAGVPHDPIPTIRYDCLKRLSPFPLG